MTAFSRTLADAGIGVNADSFTRTVATGNTWGTSDTGVAWVFGQDANTSQYSVDGSTGVFGPSINGLGQTLSGRSFTDCEAVFRALVTGLPTGNSAFVQSVLRRGTGGSTDNYRASLVVTAAGDIQVQLSKSVSGVSSTLSGPTTVSAGGWTATDYWWIRFQAVGSTLKVRVWKDGTTEPTTWNITVTDTSIAAGETAVRYVGAGSTTAMATAHIDDYYVQPFDSIHKGQWQVLIADAGISVDRDQFFRTQSAAPTWGVSDTGAPWSLSDTSGSVFSVGNGYARIAPASLVAYGQQLANRPFYDAEASAKFRFNGATSGTTFERVNAQLVLRRSATANYRASLSLDTLGNLNFRVDKTVAGVSTQIVDVTLKQSGYVTGDWWWMKFRTLGTRLQLRVWKDGTTEPSTWDVDIPDKSPVIEVPGDAAVRYAPGTTITAWPSMDVASFQVVPLDRLGRVFTRTITSTGVSFSESLFGSRKLTDTGVNFSESLREPQRLVRLSDNALTAGGKLGFGTGLFGAGRFGGTPGAQRILDTLAQSAILAPPPIPVPHRFATYTIEVSWQSQVYGVFQVDRSLVGGPDPIGASSWGTSFLGAYDNIVYQKTGLRVTNATWTRGRSDDLSEMQAGTCTIQCADPAGVLNPHNQGLLTNMLPNPSFATGSLDRWDHAGTLTSFTAATDAGGRSIAFGYAAITTPYIYDYVGVPVSPGQVITIGGTITNGNRACTGVLYAQFLDANGALVSQPAATFAVNNWTFGSASFVVPPGATTLRPIFQLSGSVVGDVIGWDELFARDGDHVAEGAAAYQDGDMYGNHWAGAQSNSATYTGGPLYGKIRPLRPCRIVAHFGGVDYPVYYGFVRSTDFEPQGKSGTATLELTDFFVWLDSPRRDQPNAAAPLPVIAQTSVDAYGQPLTTGGAIGLVLDYVGWTDQAMRVLAQGDLIPAFRADGDKTALQLISELTTAALGFFYVDTQGRAVFEDRYTRALRSTQAAFVNVMTQLGTGVSLDRIRNRWVATVQSFAPGGGTTDGATMTSLDQPSINEFGERAQQISSPYWFSSSWAQQIADYMVLATKSPSAPLWSLQLDNRDVDTFAKLLALELERKITVIEAETGTAGDFFVEQIQGTIDAPTRRHSVTLILSQPPVGGTQFTQPFIVGRSVVGGADILLF